MIFAIVISLLFLAASGVEFYNGNFAKGIFYLLSSGINVVVLWMR